jgi:hypothetical protein
MLKIKQLLQTQETKTSVFPGYSPGIFALYSLSKGFVKKPGKAAK